MEVEEEIKALDDSILDTFIDDEHDAETVVEEDPTIVLKQENERLKTVSRKETQTGLSFIKKPNNLVAKGRSCAHACVFEHDEQPLCLH